MIPKQDSYVHDFYFEYFDEGLELTQSDLAKLNYCGCLECCDVAADIDPCTYDAEHPCALPRKECEQFQCAACVVNTLHEYEYYMVHDEIWDAAVTFNGVPKRSMLCLGCVERAIGRALTSQDFTDAPVNFEGSGVKSDRLMARLADGRGTDVQN